MTRRRWPNGDGLPARSPRGATLKALAFVLLTACLTLESSSVAARRFSTVAAAAFHTGGTSSSRRRLHRTDGRVLVAGCRLPDRPSSRRLGESLVVRAAGGDERDGSGSSTMTDDHDDDAFERLRAALGRLNNFGPNHGGKVDGSGQTTARVVSASSDDDETELLRNATDVNSLLFLVSSDAEDNEDTDAKTVRGVPVVIVVPSSQRVDLAKLRDAVLVNFERLGLADSLFRGAVTSSVPDVRLAPSEDVRSLCGFSPGTVPPLAGRCSPPSGGEGEGDGGEDIPTLVDASLEDATLLGGGGREGLRCLVECAALVRGLGRVALSDLTKSRGEERSSAAGAEQEDERRQIQSKKYARPFFPAAPPARLDDPDYISNEITDGGKSTGATDSATSDDAMAPVVAVGRLTSVRKLARRLVFADLAPPSHPFSVPSSSTVGKKPKDDADESELPWRSGEDGRGMAVQLIAGKTLCHHMGEEAGGRVLRGMKAGQLVLVRGRSNVGAGDVMGRAWTDSGGNWMRRRNLDVVVTSFEVLEEGDGKAPGGGDLARNVSTRGSNRGGAASTTEAGIKSELPFLTLSDIYGCVKSPADPEPRVLLVDCPTSVQTLSNELSRLLELAAETTSTAVDKGISASWGDRFAVGIDCEWRPGGMGRGLLLSSAQPGEQNPVALLQISVPSSRRVFLVDAHTLLRSGLPLYADLNPVEAALDHALENMLRSEAVLKVGFAVPADFRRLAASFPHMTCFREVHSVVDVQPAARRLLVPGGTRQPSSGSLQRLVRSTTGRDLDKAEQCSDWVRRPLRDAQVQYAAIDAAAPPYLLGEMLKGGGSEAVDDVERIMPKLCHSWRFLVLPTGADTFSSALSPVVLHRLKAKRVVDGAHVISQSWTTGSDSPGPASPPEAGAEDGPYTDKGGVRRVPSTFVGVVSDDDGANGGIPKEAIATFLGTKMGRSKAACLESIVAASLREEETTQDRPPRGDDSGGDGGGPARLEFNPKAGYVELSDAVAMFVNHPGRAGRRGGRRSPYPNEWLEGGRVLTWFLSEREWDGGRSELARKLLGNGGRRPRLDDAGGDGIVAPEGFEEGGKEETAVGEDATAIPGVPTSILFVRTGDDRDEFLCCGRCSVETPPRGEGGGKTRRSLVLLRLRLLDWAGLIDGAGDDDFAALLPNGAAAMGTFFSPPENANDAAVAVDTDDAERPDGGDDSDSAQFQEELSGMVLSGDVVGALTKALDASGTSPGKRSVEAGIGCLKNVLARSDHPDVVRAVEALDEAAERLGLF